MNVRKKILIFILLCFFSLPAFALYYSHPTHVEAHADATDYASRNFPAGTWSLVWVVIDYSSATYSGWRVKWNGNYYHYFIAPHDECPDGYDQETGLCAPPPCDPPNYIDVYSNECIVPEEVCYTDLESMADECIYLGTGDPDPDDAVPEGCAIDSTGRQICLTEDPNCYTINGIEACAATDSVCGWKNGTYNCVAPEEEGCGYFNGERVCFTPEGDKVEEDSPDHPDNGGNLDGNETNDPMDPRDPTTEGGDPDDQTTPPDTTDADRASEETARKQLAQLYDLNRELKNNTNAINQGFDSLTEEGNPAAIEATADSIANTPIEGMQDLQDGLATNPLDETAANGVGSSVTGLVPQGTCSELGFNFNGHLFSLSCEKTQKIRDLLSWVLYFLTVWILFDIVTSPVVRRA